MITQKSKKLYFYLLNFLIFCQCYQQLGIERPIDYQMASISYCTDLKLGQSYITYNSTYSITHTIMEILQSDNNDNLAYISQNNLDKSLIIAFRGTKNSYNWIQNIDAIQEDCMFNKDIKCHLGFQKAYKGLSKKLQNVLPNYINQLLPNSAIYITGHSLGAALATISVMDLYTTLDKNVFQKVRFSTYGSPRVGSLHIREYFNEMFNFDESRHCRFTHRDDPVIHLPLQDMILSNFIHVSNEQFYIDDDFQDLKKCDLPNSKAEDQNLCSNSRNYAHNINDHLKYFNLFPHEFCNTTLLIQNY